MTATDFTDLPDLVGERVGGAAIVTNDDFFASKDNLVKAVAAEWKEHEYTDRGKWMDGWESRRRRTPGNDWCILRLGLPGIVRGVVVDTAFFRGNYPQACALFGCAAPMNATDEWLTSDAAEWVPLLPRSELKGDAKNLFAVSSTVRVTHVRLDIFPDGGVARLRVHGDARPAPRWRGAPGAEVDLASIENGASVVACNDMFFGSRHNLIFPGRSTYMGDGWETKRSRREGPDWALVRLGAEGVITRVELDTNHFKGNFPESAAIDVCTAPSDADAIARAPGDLDWVPVLARTKLMAHTRHFYEAELAPHTAATHARIRIWPDGGVSRLRLWGVVSPTGREQVGLAYLDALTAREAQAVLAACCGSNAWARVMAAARPFKSLAALTTKGDEVWAGLSKDDWLEAFKAHPRIGEKKAAVDRGAEARRWANDEQRGVTGATQATLDALAEANREYEARFGHVYLVCATGKSADEMLALARQRLSNDPATELRVAADEQRKITELRLRKLVQG